MCVCVCVYEQVKDDDSQEALLEGLAALRQILESSADTPPSEPDIEPNLPQPDALQMQYNHRYVCVTARDVVKDLSIH